MGIFERRGGDRRKDDTIEIDPALDQLRYAWDPALLLPDLQHLAAEANINGYHLWDSNARLQLCASATWMAAVRQVTGNTLLAYAEALDEDGKVPPDVASTSQLTFSEVQRWREFREVAFTENTPLTLPDTFDVDIQLPDPGDASVPLMNGLKSTTEQLLFIHYPALETVVDGSFRKPLFNQFRTYLEYERDQLQIEAAQLNREWDEELDPEQPDGSTQYEKVVDLYTKTARLGITSLVPGFSDDRYRLILKHRPRTSTSATPPPPSAAPHLPFTADALGDFPRPVRSRDNSRPFVAPDIHTSESGASQKPKSFNPIDLDLPQTTPPERKEKPFTSPLAPQAPSKDKPFDPSGILGESPAPDGKKPFDASFLDLTEE